MVRYFSNQYLLDYFVENLIEKLDQLADDDNDDISKERQSSTLRGFCFYLALAYNGIITLNYDLWATKINAT